MTIRRYRPGDEDAIIALIVAIQRKEFAIAITVQDQPDLADISGFYRTGAGDFWVAEHSGAIVGTIALKDIGAGDGALRKMFVAPAHRGPARVAAHRFYEKSGFERIAPDRLPPRFPRMAVDTRFYRLAL